MSQSKSNDNDDGEIEGELRANVPVERFQTFIEQINAVVDEAIIRYDQDGMRIRAVDPANVAMVDVELYHTAFTEYQVEDGAIGVNVRQIADLLEKTPDGAEVNISTEDFKKYSIGVNRFDWTQGWISPSSIREEPDLPDLDLNAEFRLPAVELRRAVEYMRFVNRNGYTSFKIDTDAPAFVAVCEGDTDDGEYRVTESDGLQTLKLGSAHSRYSNDYLVDAVNVLPDDGDVTMELGEEFPFKLRFSIGEGQVEYLQAPRIMSD